MPEDNNFEIKHPEIQALLNSLGNIVRRDLPENYGFAFFIYKKNDVDFFYISDSDRKSMKKALLEFINKTEPVKNNYKV